MANLSNLKDVVELEEEEEEDEFESFSYAMQLSTSITLSMALQTAAEIGIFDVLQKAGKGAPLSAHDIVSRISFNNINNPEEAARMLDRILALLTSHSILNCSILQDQQKLGYTMAPVARFFAPNSDGVSLAPLLALTNDKIYLDVWSQFNDAIREGGNSFKMVHGADIFEYCRLDSRFNKVFNRAMMNHSTIVMKKVLECYKGFEEVKRVVDVGGGVGMSINMITSKYPHIKGINFDLPHVIQHAPSYPGVEHIGGDMFQSVPNGDVVFMKWILHDWSDEYCLKLLKNCYDAIPDDGKVIVLEAFLPIMPNNSTTGKSIALLDILMMTHCSKGKERTKNNFLNLAIEAGFRGIIHECCVYGFWVIEFFK